MVRIAFQQSRANGQKEDIEKDIGKNIDQLDHSKTDRFGFNTKFGKRDRGKGIESHNKANPLNIFRVIAVVHPRSNNI